LKEEWREGEGHFLYPVKDIVAKHLLKRDDGCRNYILSALTGIKIMKS